MGEGVDFAYGKIYEKIYEESVQSPAEALS